MKKLSISVLAISLLSSLVFFSSCEKENVLEENSQVNELKRQSGLVQGVVVTKLKRTAKQIAEDENFERMIKTASIGLLKFSRNQAVRQEITSLVNEQFDDDYNTLLRTLKEHMSLSGIDVSNQFKTTIDEYKDLITRIDLANNAMYQSITPYSSLTKISKAVNGFQFSGDNKMYLQVYIPFIEQVDVTSVPIIALGMADQPVTDGYRLREDGTIEYLLVTEEMARENLVWVVSVNETVDSDGKLADNVLLLRSKKGSEKSMIPLDNSVRINELLVTSKKECWLCGKADVSIVVSALNQNCQGQEEIEQRIPFRKVKGNEVGDLLQISEVIFPSQEISPNYRPIRSNENFGWILFERDANNNSNSQTISIPGCNNRSYVIHSAETPYGVDGFQQWGSRNIWSWHETGLLTYNGDINTPAGSGINFELRRVD